MAMSSVEGVVRTQEGHDNKVGVRRAAGLNNSLYYVSFLSLDLSRVFKQAAWN
jgi:hypothetical protein